MEPMSGKYFVSANEEQGARWPFTAEELLRAAAELRPEAEVSGPYEPDGTIEISLPGEDGPHTLTYHSATPVFVFAERDEVEPPAALVLDLLRRLAPGIPTIWFADFEGLIHPLRLDTTAEELAEELLYGE
jgi:hypothetical protein